MNIERERVPANAIRQGETLFEEDLLPVAAATVASVTNQFTPFHHHFNWKNHSNRLSSNSLIQNRFTFRGKVKRDSNMRCVDKRNPGGHSEPRKRDSLSAVSVSFPARRRLGCGSKKVLYPVFRRVRSGPRFYNPDTGRWLNRGIPSGNLVLKR